MSDLHKKEFLRILEKYQRGTASPEEVAFLDAYFNIFELDRDTLEEMDPHELDEIGARLKSNIDKHIFLDPEQRADAHRGGWKWISIAASLVILTFAALYLSRSDQESVRPYAVRQETISEVKPGGNKATLTLANGTVISLTDANKGEVAGVKGIKVTKTGNGEVVYTIIPGDEHPAAEEFNTISTPRGGQYRINLPDGTRVLLNAASSLRFPLAFNGQERVVELVGEAYFEVSHHDSQRFRVISENQEITVLGTHFNVNAYKDEPTTVTTLLEGSVSVSHGGKSRIIKPGQATVVNESIEVRPAHENDIAWRDGIISFKKADIQTIMRQVSRWYDVEVSYTGKIPTRLFSGEISRASNLADLIAIFQSSNIRYQYSNRHITIMP